MITGNTAVLIAEDCEKNGVKVDFSFSKTGYRVVFYRRETAGTNVPGNVPEKKAEGLAESQKKILAIVLKNSYISKREMAKKVGISVTAIDKNISTLKKKGLIKRVGPDKGGYWKVMRK